jgi:hypothetical protein
LEQALQSALDRLHLVQAILLPVDLPAARPAAAAAVMVAAPHRLRDRNGGGVHEL